MEKRVLNLYLLLGTIVVYTISLHWLSTHGFEELVISSIMNKLMNILLAFISMRMLLLWMDTLSGIDFHEWYNTADQRSRSIYLSARFIGIALVLKEIIM